MYLISFKSTHHAMMMEMKKKIIYRGPDSKGTHVDDDIALGFRRLSIIDLADGTHCYLAFYPNK